MSMETWKPRRFVEEFQKRAGLLIDGKPGPQTQIALELVPKLPPGRLYPPVPELPEHLRAKDAPTPIDPADIRPGDVVDLYYRATICGVFPGYLVSEDGTHWVKDAAATTWYLVHRPDPDAEAVEALLDAGAATVNEDRPHDEQDYRLTRRMLRNLREQGWDVTRRQNGQEHA